VTQFWPQTLFSDAFVGSWSHPNPNPYHFTIRKNRMLPHIMHLNSCNNDDDSRIMYFL